MIRTATELDATVLWTVRKAAIQAISTQYYSETQLNAWWAGRTVASYRQPILDKTIRVAEDQGTVVGYAQLDPHRGEIQALYVQPTYSGRGIGTALLHDLERQAQALGLVELSVESSLNAVGFYAKAGYCQYNPAATVTHPWPADESIAMMRRLVAR